MFNHYSRDISASSKFQKIWPRYGALSAGSWAQNSRRPSGAYSSENIKTHFQIDVIFLNKPHIWSLNNYILA